MTMHFSKDSFLSCVNSINADNYNYGNEVLYRNCGLACLPAPGASQMDTKLSSAIWLIGKSYSADPTRSAPKGAFSNKGLGSSFESIANSVYQSAYYEGFYHALQQLSGKTYTYRYEDDQEILLQTVTLVHALNEMIKNAMEKDTADAKSDNVISFCSKLLHFMCPNLFFIIDSYSYNGAVALFSGNTAKTLRAPASAAAKNVSIDKDARQFFKQNYSLPHSCVNDFSDSIKAYYNHCLRGYRLACFFNDCNVACFQQIESDPHSCYMPRLVDSVLMRIEK